MRLHCKDGDGGENSDVRHNVNALTALRLVSTGTGGESGDIRHKVKAVMLLRLVRTETAVRTVTSVVM